MSVWREEGKTLIFEIGKKTYGKNRRQEIQKLSMAEDMQVKLPMSSLATRFFNRDGSGAP